MKRIAFILGSMGRGGAERVISILSRDYAEKGWDVDIILLLINEVSYELHPNVRVHNLCGTTESRIKRVPYWLSSIRKYLKSNSPDVIVSFAARINILSLIASLSLDKKIFVSERNDPNSDGRGTLVNIATRLLYPRASGVIFQTQRAANYFPYLSNGTIIPNPIKVKCVSKTPQKEKIVAVGRLTSQKNHKMLILAFSYVLKEFPNSKLEIYGDGELESELKQFAIENHVYEHINFMGNVDNIHEMIADATVFALSSDYEGLSNALLEALTMGIPCVSTNCAGSDEYIINDANGILVPVGDSLAMSEAIIHLLKSERVRESMRSEARKMAVVFSEEGVLEKWHNFIDK